MERYEAVCTHCLVQIKHLRTRYFVGYGGTRRKILVTDLKSVQCGFESHRPYSGKMQFCRENEGEALVEDRG